MRKWLLFVLLLGVLIFPSSANAQGGTKLKSIHIELWSEYDQPSMLVIHEFTVAESTPLPVQVKLRFPKGSNLTAIAYLDEQGELISTTEYTGPEARDEWQIVTLNVNSYQPYRIEYYQPLTRNGNQRSFSFRWIGDYAVDEYAVAVQLPADSANVMAEPAFTNTLTSDDGLYFIGTVALRNLKMGQANEFKIQYERQSDTVSKPSNSSNIQPAEPVGPNTEGRVSIDNLPWIIGGFGLALIGLALFFYFRSTQAPERKTRRRRRAAAGEDDGAEEQAYCHECGTRAHAGDRFCRTCGSKIRV
jgi:hypothetical protein